MDRLPLRSAWAACARRQNCRHGSVLFTASTVRRHPPLVYRTFGARPSGGPRIAPGGTSFLAIRRPIGVPRRDNALRQCIDHTWVIEESEATGHPRRCGQTDRATQPLCALNTRRSRRPRRSGTARTVGKPTACVDSGYPSLDAGPRNETIAETVTAGEEGKARGTLWVSPPSWRNLYQGAPLAPLGR
jgi:hypothetical protein